MKVIISLHGVRAGQGKKGWQAKLGNYIKDSGRTDIYYLPYRYGWIPAFYSVIPFIRNYHVKKFRKWLYKKIYPLYGQENIAVIAHSFGSYISFHALKNSMMTKKLILFGGILHCRESFKKIIPDKIESCDNFHSIEDEVCRFNPLGHSGTFGFRKGKSKKWHKKPYLNKEIINHRCFTLEHGDYFPEKFSDILKLIN